MSLLHLCLLTTISLASGPIELTADLNLRVPAETPYSFDLDTAVQGQNLTYSLSGHYSDSQGNPLVANLPGITQRLKLTAQVNRPTTGAISAATGRLVEDKLRSHLVYGIDGAQVTTWDLTNPAAPVLVTTSPAFYRGDPLVSIGYFATENRQLLLLVTVNQLTITLGAAETTATTTTTLLSSLTNQFTLPDTFLTATFTQLSEEVLAMVTTASTVEVYGLQLALTQKVVFHYSITQKDLQTTTLTPVYARSEGTQGVLCDAILGVALFNVASLLTSTPTFHLSALDSQPSLAGTILTCDFYNYDLFVSTSGGILQYDVSSTSLQPIVHFPRYLHNNEQAALSQAVGLSNSWFTAEYEVSQILGTKVTTLRVYESVYRDVESAIVCDVWNQQLFGTDTVLSPTPAFLLYSPPYADFILFYSYSSLLVYTVFVDAILSVNTTLAAGYTFTGQLSITNDEQQQTWVQFPLTISGLDSEASTIYATRGALPSLYARPSNISDYIEPESSGENGYYLPLSNYFSGHNISYTATNLVFSDVTLTLPPKWSFLDAYNFSDISLTTFVLQLPPLPRIAVIHNFQVSLFDVSSSPTLLTSLSSSESDSTIYNIGDLLCEDKAILVIESGKVDFVSGLYNITWDFYTVADPVTLKLTMNFPDSTPASALTTAVCSVFALRGSAVDAYELSTIPWTLTPGTEVTGNLPCAPLNPVSIAVTPDSKTLFMYDLSLGLAFADVSNLAASSYSCQVVPQSVQNPNPATRLETSASYVYLLLPKANAIPQLIEYDITDLPTVQQTQYLPSLGDCAYMDVAATASVLTVLCVETTRAQVMVFDPDATSYESLYTAIPMDGGGSIIAYRQKGGEYVLAYDGQNIYRYSILQQTSSWFPYSSLVPQSKAISTYLRLEFPTQIDAHQYYVAQLEITATSGLSGLTSVAYVNVTLENPGSFIYVDPSYSLSVSRLAAGGNLKVDNSTVALGLPNMVFSGGNIQYELMWQGNGTQKVIQPSASCSQQAEPCLLGKAAQLESFDTYTLTSFTKFGDQLIGSAENLFVILQSNTPYWAVSRVIPLNLDEGNVTCSSLQQLTPSEEQLILAVCTAGSTSFVAVFNLQSLNNTDLYVINYDVQFIFATYDSHQTMWMVYLSDGLNVNALVVVPENEQGHHKLQRFGVINAVSLNLAEMYPAAVTAANNTYVYLSDFSKNLYALHPEDFSLISTYTADDVIVSLQLGTDNQNLYAATSGGTVLILDSELKAVRRKIPPLSALESVTLWNHLAVDSAEEWLALAVFDGSHYTVRVMDLTPYTVHSEIYTSMPIGPFKLGRSGLLQGGVLIVNESPSTFEVAVMQQFADFPLPLQFFSVQKSPSVTFYPGPQHSEMMQLRVYNAYSSYTCDPLNVTYGFLSPGEDPGDPYRDRSDFNHWYVWLLLSLGAFLILVGVGLVIGRLLGRKKSVREDPLLSLPSISREAQT